jgi:lipoprotein YgeR
MRKLSLLFLLIFFISCASRQTAAIKTQSTAYSTPSQGTYCIVKKGDSLWRISKRYNVDVNILLQQNDIASAQDLKIGQKIFIPSSRQAKTTSSFLWPIKGEVINFFGENVDNSTNKGLNIKADPGNKTVNASAQGRVVFSNDLKGWGKTIILDHGSSIYTIYANLNKAVIQEGGSAKKGQAIGELASERNGNYILHFEIRKNYIPQDPLQYIN